MYEKLAVQDSWAARGVDEWYIGGETEHYRCPEIYVKPPNQTRNGDTIDFFTHNCKIYISHPQKTQQ